MQIDPNRILEIAASKNPDLIQWCISEAKAEAAIARVMELEAQLAEVNTADDEGPTKGE